MSQKQGRVKCENGVTAYVRLPKDMLALIEQTARQRAYEQARDYTASDMMREVLVRHFSVEK